MTGTILYATSILPARDSAERLARRRQSAAARRLLEGLGEGLAVRARSMSHSRCAVAAAVGDANGLLLGIDIEWMSPDRDFAAIAGFFLDPPPAQIGAVDFYRGWTFFEAYFKAFQRLPPERDLRAVIACSGHDMQNLSEGAHLLQLNVAGEFQLSLVWHAPTLQTCVLRHVSDRDVRNQHVAAADS